MPAYIDNTGATQQIDVSPSDYRAASERNLTLRQMINIDHPVQAGAPSAWEQLCASEGLFVSGNGDFALAPPTMDAIINGKPKMEAGTIVKDAVPASRILFPMFQMSAIEDKLRSSDYGIMGLFNSAAAVVDTINADRFERPILNFDKPEAARSRPIAQLSEPASMLTITASDKSWRITGTSLGMEISDQAMTSTSLNLVTLAMVRQAEIEMQEKIEVYMVSFLNGDADVDMAALSTVSGAVTTAQSFDSTISADGALTQKAWVKWLFNNSRKRRIDYIICNLDTALAIEGRTGRPVVTGDNATSKRIDTMEDVVNPMWPDKVKVLISMDPNFPANTVLGFDSRYGYHVVNSTVLNYNAAESFAMKRSTKYRVDTGVLAYRLFDEAWSVLALTV